MDDQQAETVRLHIVTAIGRDAQLLTASDPVRHFDGVSFVAFYGGQLFLHFVLEAAPKVWEKLTEAATKKLVDVGWQKAAQLVGTAFSKGEAKTDAEQVAQIRQVSSGLDALRQAVGQEYLSSFLAAGQAAVEERLRADHLPEAKARRIAAAVTKEVADQLAHPPNG